MSQSPTFSTALVRFHDTTGSFVSGAGFLISNHQLLTCAHVIKQSFGNENEFLDRSVNFDFPYLNLDQTYTATIATEQDLNLSLDLALLTIDPEVNLPATCQPLPLLLTSEFPLVGQRFEAVGFPLGSSMGIEAQGEVQATLPGDILQIAGDKLGGYTVQRGFSGGPLWSLDQNGMIGVIAQADNDAASKAAMAIPISSLYKWRPDLDYVNEPRLILTGGKIQAERRYGDLFGEIDTDFVELTLLVEQEDEHVGRSFADATKTKMLRLNSVAALLAEVAATDHRSLVILGKPGSGKSTLLRHHIKTFDSAHSPSGLIPLFFSLNGYSHESPPPQEWLADQWNQLRQRQIDDQPAIPALPKWEWFFGRIPLLLCLDGLNEMPHKDGAEFKTLSDRWQTFLHQMPSHSRALFSCRSLDYSQDLGRTGGEKVKQIRLESLNAEKIQAFLEAYLPSDKASLLWSEIAPDPKQIELFSNPFFLRLLTAIEQERQDSLPDGPLPVRNRAALLTEFVFWALKRDKGDELLAQDRLFSFGDQGMLSNQSSGLNRYALPDQGLLIPKLQKLAYEMQLGELTEEAKQVKTSRLEAIKILELEDDPLLADSIFKLGARLNILDSDDNFKNIFFFHQMIQEYFAAREVAEAPEPELVRLPWRANDQKPTLAELLPKLDSDQKMPSSGGTGWDETFVLAAPMMPKDRLDRFVLDVAECNLPLAARCLAEPGSNVSDNLQVQIQEQMLQRLSNKAADLRARIHVAEQLHLVGDPRFVEKEGSFGKYIQPSLVPIKAGRYLMPPEDSTKWSRFFRRRKYRYDVAAFKIAKYPVTNLEYGCFIESGGYMDDRWWPTEDALNFRNGIGRNEAQLRQWKQLHTIYSQWTEEQINSAPNFESQEREALLDISRMTEEEFLEEVQSELATEGEPLVEPEYWNDSRFNQPNQPVVGVSWYEALAYCVWLSAQTGQQVDLPTEGEWQAVAGGLKGQEYPYGSNFDPLASNTFESRLKQTTPVGVYPNGQSQQHVYDLSGNIYEWTTSLWGEAIGQAQYDLPYDPQDGREDRSAGMDVSRVVRGGSWNGDSRLARSASRGGYDPSNRFNYVGFRLIVRPPSQ